MLEKYDIEVDMAESAELAIEYLKHNRPDAIFMDHLMPGMDGLQAVQAIKSNPQTAMIPIMMYTSQEGELYVGQARALGAMGVLPKQVRPVDVSKVLYELHLLPDRRDLTEPGLSPVEIEDAAPVERIPRLATETKPAGADWGRRVELSVKEQTADIRRFMVASLDSFAARIVSDLRSAGAAPISEPAPPAGAARTRVWPWVVSLLALCAIASACAVALLLTREELKKSHAEIVALNAANSELQQASRDSLNTVKALTDAFAASAANAAAAGPGTANLDANGTGAVRRDPVRPQSSRPCCAIS